MQLIRNIYIVIPMKIKICWDIKKMINSKKDIFYILEKQINIKYIIIKNIKIVYIKYKIIFITQ